jgi:hypothetical protein
LNYLFIQFSFLYLSRLIYLGIFLDGQCCWISSSTSPYRLSSNTPAFY